MRIQDLAIIFLIIILPISIILAAYTQYQIKTINTQTLYDNKLSSATYDTLRAFQSNSGDNEQFNLNNSRVRDLESTVPTFKKLVMSIFSLDGYTQDDLDNYIPALVYTLYDGFYIYSPYKNTTYREGDEPKQIYGLKPYISYSCRYKKEDNINIDVVITYALDNHITVQGMIGNEYVNRDGYLIDNIEISDTGDVTYNGVTIESEKLEECIPLNGNEIYKYPYVKLQGKKYYLDDTNGMVRGRTNKRKLNKQSINGEGKQGKVYQNYKNFIEENTLAKDYYIDAYNFTKWFKESGLATLKYDNAYDTVVDENGAVKSNEQVWKDDARLIFNFKNTTDYSKNIENELSSFNQHRLAVIRHKIEVNLAIAIANYNEYSGANNVFQMPDLKENEWDYIIHNISLISFLQGLPIGGKIYNGYSIATNSESKEVVLEQNIYILCKDANAKLEYCRIGDQNINDDTIYAGDYDQSNGKYVSAGRLNLDFKRDMITNDDENTLYYYPIQDYIPSYNSIVMQNNVDTYDDIYVYVNNSKSNKLKKVFYTALGRERAGNYKTIDDYKLNEDE